MQQREERVYGKSILALAALCRLGVVWLMLTQFPTSRLFDNAPDLGYLAQSLNAGRGLSSPFGGETGPTAFVAPGYPALIALLFHLFGSYSRASALAILLAQALFAVLTVAAILYVGRRVGGARTANLAGAFWAVSLPLLWQPAIFWDTCLSTLFLIGMIAWALRVEERPGRALWMVVGAYCGVVLLVNPSLLLAMFAIFGWAAYRSRLHSRLHPLLGLLVLLAIFAPWPVRNARVLHAFIPLRSSLGYELWQGNRVGADGVFHDSLYLLKNRQEYDDYASRGEVAYMHEKSELAEAYIREHPGLFCRLSASRFLRFWTGAGGSDNSRMVEAHVVATSLMGLLGLGLLFRKRSRFAMLFLFPVVLLPLPYYVTHPDFRFRMLLDPVMTILGANAVVWLIARRKFVENLGNEEVTLVTQK